MFRKMFVAQVLGFLARINRQYSSISKTIKLQRQNITLGTEYPRSSFRFHMYQSSSSIGAYKIQSYL
ncbi:hypothetical protein HanXRQr2_Chr09g0389471 [Helianthus annuus]|uniref:Uncharacterized protein n=1 Tax=Helianthus annuus TaxID=4232 RepID=A0A9K3I6I3_HELAN|nr:hypothetical protein HanXRQr2_Chr09g0389471 [Helianthus annuus]